jgi:O-antigen/teichoic acid export membrane protein
MFSFSIKIFLTSIFSKITENIFSILLGKFYDEKIVGYYTQGNKWATIGGTFITNMVNNVAMPILTQINDEKERQKNAFRKMLRFGAFVSFPLLLGLSFIGKDFLLIIGNSDKWQPVTPFLQLFCIWNSVYFIWSLYISILFAHKKSNIYLWGTLIVGSLQLTAIITLFNYGILPMLTAYICIYFIGLLFFHYYTNKLIGLKLFHVIKDIAPYLIITIGCILISWLITKNIEYIYLRFALKIILTALLYFTIVWMNNSTIIKECHAFIQKKLIK